MILKINKFFENIFQRLGCTKILRKVKMQLSPKSSNVRSPLSDSGEHVWPDLAKMAWFRPNSSWSGQIRPNPGHVGQILLDLDHFGQTGWVNGRIWSDPVGSPPFWSDPAGFWPWPDSGQIRPESGPSESGDNGRISPDSGADNILVAGCCRILVPLGFRRPTTAEFR